jgi:hypothetical protein
LKESPLLTIDVAHPPRHPDVVEEELLRALSQVRNSSTLRILKVIHGYGSSGKGGSTKDVVHNWMFRNRNKCKMIIDGEKYSLYHPDVQEMRKTLGNYEDPDLSSANPGITIIWVK